MNSFVKAFIFGLATMFIMIVIAVVTIGMGTGGDLKIFIKKWVLSEAEEAVLSDKKEEELTPPNVRILEKTGDDIRKKMVEDYLSSESQSMLEELRQRKAAVHEKEKYLDRKENEIKIAYADLRVAQQRLLDNKKNFVNDQKEADENRVRWLDNQKDFVNQLSSMDKKRKARLEPQVRAVSTMKPKEAWAYLRRFSAKEIAEHFALMEDKKAAKILSEAVKDEEMPTLPSEIHKAWGQIDFDGMSGGHIKLMAKTYSFLKPKNVVSRLLESKVSDAAVMLNEIQAINPKKAALIRLGLQKADPDFEKKVLDYDGGK